MADKQVKIKITSAVGIRGEIKKPGTVITVAEDIAKNLLQRGRAELATKGTDDDGDKDLSDFTVPELKARAAELEIDGADTMKKAELIDAIEAAEAE